MTIGDNNIGLSATIDQLNRKIKLLQKDMSVKDVSLTNLQALIDNSSDNLWSIDKNYNIIVVNSKMKADFKTAFNVELDKGVNALTNIPEPIYSTWKERYNRVLAGEEFSAIDHFEIDNVPEYVEVYFTPIFSGKKIIGGTCFSRDITGLKQTELELFKNRGNLKALIENTKDSIWSIDKYYMILTINHNFQAEFELAFKHKLQIGDCVLDYLPEPYKSLWKDRYNKALSGEHLKVVDEFNFNNRQMFIEILFSPIYIKNRIEGVSCFTRDITELRQSEQALTEVNATKDKFLSIIAHDLKSPFNSILGFCDILEQNYDEYSDEERKMQLGLIANSARNTYALIENLLNWAHTQRQGLNIEKQDLKLKQLVYESINPIQQNAKDKNLELVVDIPDEITINADKYTASLVFRNLCTNAVKFSEKGKIKFNAFKNNGHVTILVQDEGVGMTEEFQKKLFRIDESISTPGTNNEKGTGLGLILCKEFIEKNGGSIRVQSAPGKGSTFTIELPS